MLLRALVLASLAAMLAAPPAHAVTTIPDEEVVQLAGDRTLRAMVGDVDGDDVRELVRLVPWQVNPGLQAVEVDSVRGEQVASAGQVQLWRAATPDEAFAGRRLSADGLLPLGVGEPAQLIAWRQDGVERVLVATIGTRDLARQCCLTLWRVSIADGRAGVNLIQGGSLSAASILAADLDGDGTDELVVVETPDPDLQQFVFRRVVVVLRWNGTTFDELRDVADPSAASGPLIPLGNSDGLAGDEVGFIELPRFDQVTPTLFRIGLDASGGVSVEHALLPDDGAIAPISVDGEGRLVLVGKDEVTLLAWPAGAAKPLVDGTTPRGGELLGVLGEELETRILVLRGGAVDALDATLRSQQGISSGVAATRFAFSDQPPYAGPLPGGDPGGAPAYLFGGRLLTADVLRPPLSLLAAGNASVLPGLAPVGLFGPSRDWAAVAETDRSVGSRRGGLLDTTTPISRLWVVPASAFLSPEADDGLLEPQLDGAVPDETRRIPTLLTAGRIMAELAAPAGSTLRATAASPDETQINEVVVGPAGEARVELLGPPGTDRTTFKVELRVVTPAGHGYAASWEVRVVRDPPKLSVEVPLATLGFDVTLRGVTAPGATVEVDGSPVAVAPDGSFRTGVAAGPLPRSITVSAEDPLGNRAEQSVEVIAPIDYRRLPWVPIAVGFTLLAAVVLYLRSPRPARRETDGHGTLEEID